MKNRRMLQGIIGSAVVMLAIFATAGPSFSRSPCGCGTHPNTNVWQPNTNVWTPPAPAPVMDRVFSGLQYRDGYPGHRLSKRQQVKKLQCMLNALGYYAGAVDGWYGKETGWAVKSFLYNSFQEDSCGGTVSIKHWRHLKSWVGDQCRKYNRF